MIGYDPDFKTYSPGKTVFLGMLQDMSEQGVQQFHLGGNVVGWKDDWQSCCLQVNLVEFWVNPFFVLVQGVKKVLRRH
jgi:CelD/BcsL family acetyltransferase involved in cellulose biosynthesis